MCFFQRLLDCQEDCFYIHRNIESDNIYLITDKHSFGFFSKRFRSRYNISLIDEEEIVADRRQLEAIAGRHFTCEYRFGWYYQQFLKMEFARSRYAKDYYLIWDSDTIPLNPVSFLTPEKWCLLRKQNTMSLTSERCRHLSVMARARTIHL